MRDATITVIRDGGAAESQKLAAIGIERAANGGIRFENANFAWSTTNRVFQTCAESPRWPTLSPNELRTPTSATVVIRPSHGVLRISEDRAPNIRRAGGQFVISVNSTSVRLARRPLTVDADRPVGRSKQNYHRTGQRTSCRIYRTCCHRRLFPFIAECNAPDARNTCSQESDDQLIGAILSKVDPQPRETSYSSATADVRSSMIQR